MASQDSVAVIGSGGIGGFVAAELVRAGRDVTVCVRTPFPKLTIESGGETRDVSVGQATDPGEVGPTPWVMLTTKAQDTAGAGPWLRALHGPDTTVVVVQNGIGHHERADPVAAGSRIVPAIIWCSVERVAPGHVVHHGGTRIAIPKDARSGEIVRLFAGSGFEVVEAEDFVTIAWRKLLSNLVGNAVTALTLRRSRVFAEPSIGRLARTVLDEAVAVGTAAGAALGPADIEQILSGLGRLGPDSGTSMLYDRLGVRPLEHEHLTGALVREADRHGVPVPVNRTLLALLAAASGHALDASD